MTTLQAQWTELLDLEPDDWSHLAVELTIEDPERMEEAALSLSPLNPWHGRTWRTGRLRFRVARTYGYGADDELVRTMLGRLDAADIAGRLRILRSIDAARPVATQGPLL